MKVSDSNVDSVANVTEIHEGLYLDDVEGEERSRGDHFGIFSIAWAANGREFVAGTGDFTVLVFDMEKAKVRLTKDAVAQASMPANQSPKSSATLNQRTF